MRAHQHGSIFLGVAMSAALLVDPAVAVACGCLSPPAVAEGEYAVNQRAEQIIFEVEPNWVTAHVLIKYAGDPAKFAWLIPVPEIPELAISPISAFGLLDRATAPDVTVAAEDLCPVSAWSCAYHAPPGCGAPDLPFADAGFASDAGGGGAPPVTVISEQVVGDYQTVTFRASEANAATQWLRDNGFIVNQTTSIYMESYVQADMVFIAAKLVPGAGVRSIKPLRLRYRAAFPMIPLVLTAVAAEPHLTVTSFVYGTKPFRPQGHPVVTLDPARLARDRAGRLNYPMVLARTIDEAGGDGFAIEYRGGAPRPDFGGGGGCCGNEYDSCGLGGNTQCECPRDEFDQADCASTSDIVEGVQLLDTLAARYPVLTRITTRVSAEEMTFDPTFEPDYAAAPTGRLTLQGQQASLAGCSAAVVDQARYAELEALQGCASLYCGPGSTCVTTASGPACACSTGTVAHRFDDLDSLPSVTCIPEVPPVDLRAEGQELPDACAGVSCGSGRCIDRNGVAVCACHDNAAAIAGTGETPRCEPIVHVSQSPGAQDFSEALRTLDVCAAPAPACSPGGWLVHQDSPRPGVSCGNIAPSPLRFLVPPAPACAGAFGCGGCQETPDASPVTALAGGLCVGLALLGRRRKRARA